MDGIVINKNEDSERFTFTTRIALDTCKQWAEKNGWQNMINRAAAMCLGPKKKKDEEYTPDKVVLSTLHGSKGLEWKKSLL